MLKIGEITNVLDDGKFEVMVQVVYDHSVHQTICTKHIPPLDVKYIARARKHKYEYKIGDSVVIDINDDSTCRCERLPPIIQYKLVDN